MLQGLADDFLKFSDFVREKYPKDTKFFLHGHSMGGLVWSFFVVFGMICFLQGQFPFTLDSNDPTSSRLCFSKRLL